jgi:hypothetical protein
VAVRVWLSYDLGVKGDYTNLYLWLDEHKALECGDSIATFSWDNNDDIKEGIKESLKSNIEFKKNDRVYLIFKKEAGNYTGSFIIGKRKPSPWKGCSSEFTEDDE